MNRIERAGAKTEALATSSPPEALTRRSRFWAGLNRYLAAEERRVERHTPNPTETTEHRSGDGPEHER